MNNYTSLASAYRWHLISIGLLGVIVLADIYYKKVSLDTLDIIPIAIAALKVSTPWTVLITALATLSNYWLDRIQPFREAIWVTTAKDTVVFVLLAIALDQNRRRYEAVLELSRVDPLTGLANKRALDEAIYEAVAILGRSFREAQRQPFSIIFMDLDKFKVLVNDKYGHYAGDLVIKLFAQWIKFYYRRGTDTVARKGGDEFVIVVRHGTNGNESKIRWRTEEFLSLVLKKFFLNGAEQPNENIQYKGPWLTPVGFRVKGPFIDLTKCGVSIGIATFYGIGNRSVTAIGLPDLLISKAYAECKNAKITGRSIYESTYGKNSLR